MTEPVPVPVGTVRHNSVKIHFSINGGSSSASTTIYFSGPTFNSSAGQLQTWADAAAAGIVGAVGPELTGMLSTSTEIQGLTCAYGEGREQHAAAFAEVVPIVGIGTVPRPGQDALVFSLRTARTGKSYRGRLYWPYSGGAVNDTGQAVFTGPAALAELRAVIAGFQADSPSAGLVPVVWSRMKDLVTPVTAFSTDFAVDTQRRRKHPPVQPISLPY